MSQTMSFNPVSQFLSQTVSYSQKFHNFGISRLVIKHRYPPEKKKLKISAQQDEET